MMGKPLCGTPLFFRRPCFQFGPEPSSALTLFFPTPMTEIGCLVSLFGTGTPWCETAEDISFSNWAIQVFGAGGAPPETIIPTNRREDEFLTALGSRPGGDALLKPRSALDVAQPDRRC